jgi:hypothetical protein
MWAPWPQCRVLNRFKPSQSSQTHLSLFQIISILIRSKKALRKLEKFEIKYNCECFEEMNNVLYRNIYKFERDFELKIWEVKV